MEERSSPEEAQDTVVEGEVPSALYLWRANTYILHPHAYNAFSMLLLSWLTFLRPWGVVGHHHYSGQTWLCVQGCTRLLTPPFQSVRSPGSLASFSCQ